MHRFVASAVTLAAIAVSTLAATGGPFRRLGRAAAQLEAADNEALRPPHKTTFFIGGTANCRFGAQARPASDRDAQPDAARSAGGVASGP